MDFRKIDPANDEPKQNLDCGYLYQANKEHDRMLVTGRRSGET